MYNLWERLQQEFKAAPRWQKIFLILLLFGVLTYLALYPLWHFSDKQVRALYNKRDILSADLRAAQVLLQDDKVIINKYNTLKTKIAAELYARNDLQALVREAIQKNAVRLYELNWASTWTKDYTGIAETEVFINMRIEEQNLRQLLTALLAPAYSCIDTLNYQDNVLTIKLKYLVPYSYAGKKRI